MILVLIITLVLLSSGLVVLEHFESSKRKAEIDVIENSYKLFEDSKYNLAGEMEYRNKANDNGYSCIPNNNTDAGHYYLNDLSYEYTNIRDI